MPKKKDILNVFSSVGVIQLLPTTISFLIIAGAIIIVILLLSSPLNNGGDAFLIIVAISLCSLLLLSGLVGFFASSFHFIRAKQKYDYKRIAKGMRFLNWGWAFLCLFTAIMLFVFSIEIAVRI